MCDLHGVQIFCVFFFIASCCCIDFILFFANDFNLSAIKTSYLFATLYRRSFAYYWSIYAFHGAQIEHISIFPAAERDHQMFARLFGIYFDWIAILTTIFVHIQFVIILTRFDKTYLYQNWIMTKLENVIRKERTLLLFHKHVRRQLILFSKDVYSKTCTNVVNKWRLNSHNTGYIDRFHYVSSSFH